MKLKACSLFFAAALLVLAPGARAQSAVTLYGLASVEMLKATGVNGGTLDKPQVGEQIRLDNSKVTNSRLGFRGSEDLGGGLRAVFGMEAAVGIDTGAVGNAAAFWSRGSFVGLSSDLGTLTLGRQWNIEDSIMSRYFIGGGYAVFQFSEFGFISDLVNNAVKYVSPDMGGLTLQALVAAGEGTTGRTSEIGGTYKLGDLDVGATYRTSANLAGLQDTQSALGASYTLGAVRLHVGWSRSDMQTQGYLKARAYDVGVAWQVTPLFSSTLDYVRRDQEGTPNDSYFVRLQGDYKLSKRTSVFVNLVTLRNEGTASQKFFGSGAKGQTQNVYSVGLRNGF